MSTVTATIRPSSSFAGSFEVVALHCEVIVEGLAQRLRREVIPCHNLATARTIRDRLLNPEPVAPVAVAPVKTPEQQAGCLTGGLGYTPAVTWLLTGRVEQVHNWATARTLKRDYPPCASLTGQA